MGGSSGPVEGGRTESSARSLASPSELRDESTASARHPGPCSLLVGRQPGDRGGSAARTCGPKVLSGSPPLALLAQDRSWPGSLVGGPCAFLALPDSLFRLERFPAARGSSCESAPSISSRITSIRDGSPEVPVRRHHRSDRCSPLPATRLEPSSEGGSGRRLAPDPALRWGAPPARYRRDSLSEHSPHPERWPVSRLLPSCGSPDGASPPPAVRFRASFPGRSTSRP